MKVGSVGLVTSLLLGLAPVAKAQDTTEVEGPRAEALRQLIEERFAQRLTTELGLDQEQSTRVRVVLSTWAVRRRALEREERRNRQQLGAAMRPGVAANDQAVTRLVDQLVTGRVAYVQTFKDELADLAPILTPVQRAQYVLMRDRLWQRVQEIRNQRPQDQRPGLGRRSRPPG
jgi:hypothetical protein